ncbi:MAG TPA: hypothetical protein VI914_00140 [Thermodesulfobacteriota bacterium]|nr:hypothetical protein [Thermodesulfobacteriota bacterium]HZX35946.1 hypothetical protein [Thermodesulfobacteriota bacterium]
MKDTCKILHRWFNALRRYRSSFAEELESIPKNGIYIIFEKGETYDGLDRIVRIGTHTGNNQLRSRLYQHFTKENKDRSIFRKNIGRCFLNKESNPYLKVWNLDLTTKERRKKNASLINEAFQSQIEKKISRYIQGNLSFAVIEVDNKEERLYLESRIVSTISLCGRCKPSFTWLGLYSPKDRIRESGLWQVNELYKEQLSDGDIKRLEILIEKHN